jgi:hypothetical protein
LEQLWKARKEQVLTLKDYEDLGGVEGAVSTRAKECWDPQTSTLSYRAEGRDNPKDLWGFERSYPPRALDEGLFSEIEEIFGREIRDRIVSLVSPL